MSAGISDPAGVRGRSGEEATGWFTKDSPHSVWWCPLVSGSLWVSVWISSAQLSLPGSFQISGREQDWHLWETSEAPSVVSAGLMGTQSWYIWALWNIRKLCFFSMSYKWNCTQCSLLVLVYFTHYYDSEIYPNGSFSLLWSNLLCSGPSRKVTPVSESTWGWDFIFSIWIALQNCRASPLAPTQRERFVQLSLQFLPVGAGEGTPWVRFSSLRHLWIKLSSLLTWNWLMRN